MKIHRHLGTATLAGAAIAVAHAQIPPDAGAQFSEQQRLQRQTPDRLPRIERDETVRPALTQPGGERVAIRVITFSGALQLVPETELQALLADAIGKEHDFAGLEALAQRVTDHLKARGFLLARAYLPRQDITEGRLEIAILAGRLDSGEAVKVVPGGKLAMRIDPARLAAIAGAQLPAGQPAHQDDLQRALLLMNDLPGVTARAHMEPGGEPDSTRVVVDAEQGPLLTYSTSLDNSGNRYTGDLRVVASVMANDPLGIGDRAVASVTAAARSTQLAVNYSLPLWHDGLRLGVSASQLESRTGKEFEPLDLAAESDTLGINLSYPVVRHRLRNLWLTLAVDRRRYLDTARGDPTNKRETTPASLGLSGDLLDDWVGGGLNQGGLSYISGELDLQLPVVAAGDAAGARRAGRYDKWTWNASRLQRLPDDWSLLIAANGQFAGKNLDSSEKFALGGPYAIRAYPGSEAQGDEGHVLTLELRHDLAADQYGQWQLAGFYDSGRIRLNKNLFPGAVNTASGDNVYRLAGYGLGLSLSKPGSHQLRLTLARAQGDNPGRSLAGKNSDGLDDRTRLWLSALLWF